MPEIKAELAPPGEEVLKIGSDYTIEKIEMITDKFKGYRVVLSSDDNPIIAIPLWTRENPDGSAGRVNQQSKLGTFLRCFGNNTDNWIGKKFKILSWSLKNRQILEVE